MTRTGACGVCRQRASSLPCCTGNFPGRPVCARSLEAWRAMPCGSTMSAAGRYRAPPWPTPNALRPGAVFGDLFAAMVRQAQRGLRRAVGEATYLVDSTGVRVSGLAAEWARFSAKARGAKVHVIYDPDTDRPLYAAVTAAKVNDITAAPGHAHRGGRHLRLRPRLLRLRLVGEDGRRRMPHRYSLQGQHPADGDGGTGRAQGRQHPLRPHRPAAATTSRKNPFGDPVREVRVRIETGKVLRILSNDLDASAQDIADLYKRRWAIELFFRWVKQTLKIRHFLGTSENAVRIQIAVALIAFLLLRTAQAAQKLVESPLAFARLVRANLMH